MARDHVLIPDTQVKPGVSTEHLRWVASYIADVQSEVVVQIGDHWDYPSLSIYDRGSKAMEGRRFVDDTKAGNDALEMLTEIITRPAGYAPELHICYGNHEDRVTRAANANPQLSDMLSFRWHYDLAYGWTRHDFLDVVDIDGVWYSHYFANPMSGKPYGGTVAARLGRIRNSFVMGHQQTFDYAMSPTPTGRFMHGIVAGACYTHMETYKGRQGNHHFRGIVHLHSVENGDFSVQPITLNELKRMYT